MTTPLSLQETLVLAHFALEHAESGTFGAARDGRFLYVNENFCRTLGYQAHELLKLTLFQISPELTPELWAQLWKEITSSEQFGFEFSLKSKEGRSFPVEMTVRHMPLSDQEILCAFVQDLEERKRLQQLKNEFVSTVSHELRTPMTIVRESVSQVLDGLLGEVPPLQREALYVTLSGIDRLARIINNLLDVSKMEAGKATLRWDRINLAELIREVIETFSARARERGLELRAALPPQDAIVYADYDRLTQVFTNLVGNALKFSEKGHIEISVRERESEIECAVTDTGIGIAKEDLGRVFNKFEQLSQPAVTGEKGTGLGLSICKGIIELHQGRIWAESRTGQGSSFLFTLPRRTAQDIFQHKLAIEMAQASTTSGTLTGLLFTLHRSKKADPRRAATLSGWALDELVDTLQAHGVRKTDFILKDAEAAWVALLGMSAKETRRIVQRILEAYTTNLEKNDLAGEIHATVTQSNYPDDVKNEKELIRKLLGKKK